MPDREDIPPVFRLFSGRGGLGDRLGRIRSKLSNLEVAAQEVEDEVRLTENLLPDFHLSPTNVRRLSDLSLAMLYGAELGRSPEERIISALIDMTCPERRPDASPGPLSPEFVAAFQAEAMRLYRRRR